MIINMILLLILLILMNSSSSSSYYYYVPQEWVRSELGALCPIALDAGAEHGYHIYIYICIYIYIYIYMMDMYNGNPIFDEKRYLFLWFGLHFLKNELLICPIALDAGAEHGPIYYYHYY